ncbi:MAG: HDOD domain-containing protein [Betaproteobacteria bacterium]|nr:HDOD domain-containing protein [Betaproteobacteria bacterium]
MLPAIDEQAANNLLKGFSIPAKPSTLVAVQREQAKADPDLKKIAHVISGDPGLAAAVIKTINSPFFGLGAKVTSIPQAVVLLGLKNVSALVTSFSLRNALAGKQVSMERFWDSALHIAAISTDLARKLPGIATEDAYALGMFHDCGIAIMMQKFGDYKEFLRDANQAKQSIVALEEERYDTNHASLGYLVARSWNLPEHLCLSILHHHERTLFSDPARALSDTVLSLVAVLKIATHFSHRNRGLDDADDWPVLKEHTLRHLGITEDELSEMEADAGEKHALSINLA